MNQYRTEVQNQTTSEICGLLARNAAQRTDTISLVASENVMSPAALYACGSDLNHRYTIPPADERPATIWDYPNQDNVRLIEKRTRELAKSLYRAAYADVRPLSGNNAVISVIRALTRSGDKLMRVPADCGGHFATEPIAEALQLELIDIPYDRQRGTVDVGEMRTVYLRESPALVLFDASMVLFPVPLREIREALGDEAIISFDGSHTLGIIGGGRFQNPLAEGADLLHGSTHKSLFGPQKGMILCRNIDHIAEKISRTVMPLFVSNIHSHHVAALGVALEELTLYGQAYASRVVENARVLADVLTGAGIRVYGRERGYTECHQIWTIAQTKDAAFDAFRRLEEIGIFVNQIKVPFVGKHGLRMGLSEVTRLGMGKEEVQTVAELIVRRLQNKTAVSALRRQVRELANEFIEVHFGLSAPTQ